MSTRRSLLAPGGSSMGQLLVYAEAYAIKESHGGGFRGLALDKATKEVRKGERRDTLELARFDAKTLALALLDGRRAAPAPIYRGRFPWACNYWGAA